MGAITLAGAFLRFWQLWQFPVGFHFDEAAELIDMWRIGAAFHPIYFEANNGREPFYLYWGALFVRALGGSPHTIRLASAFLGVATIPAVYFCVSQLLRKAEGTAMARRMGLFAAAGTAVLFMHVNFSRIGLRTISLPLAESLAFGLLWLAVRRGGAWRFVIAGLTFAGCLYTYTTARLLVVLLIVYGIYWLLVQRRIENRPGLGLAGLAFVAGSLPLGIYAIAHLSTFFQRTAGVAVTDRATVLENLRRVLEMFLIRGSLNGAHNILGMPLFDWPMRAAFVVGLGILITRLRQPAYVFILLWIAVVALASIFSPDAPYYIRLTALVPPAAVIPALALASIPGWLRSAVGAAHRPMAYELLPVALVVASGAITYDHYFLVWAPSNDTYFWMMQDKVDAASYLRQAVQRGDSVFLAPLYDQDWTFQAMDRGLPIQSFDAARCWVLPPNRADAAYAFPPYDITQPGLLLPHLPPGAVERPIVNNLQQPVLIEVRVPGAELPRPSSQLMGSFAGQVGLVRAEGMPSAPVKPGATVRITLVWQALTQPAGDYTGFLHADDNVNHLRAAQDHPPCQGSFPTYRWLPGDQVFDTYALKVPDTAPAGTYQLTTGLYRLPGPQNLGPDLPVGSFQVAP
jgi:4-amino-4-deoxy-L-arabinose transferase-like glycosyltransferase